MSTLNFEKWARELADTAYDLIGSGMCDAEMVSLRAEFANYLRAAYERGAADEREVCAKLVLSDQGGGDIDFIAMLIRDGDR